ncbi:MAG TPA: RidA family protein [Firmicutes bacterium]|nr:RidA family protein [Bacillota bacterium]
MKRIIQTNEAPQAIGPYSQGVIANGMLYASGQIAIDPKVGDIVAKDIKGQVNQVMENIGALLRAAGLGYEDIVKTTVFLQDIGDFTTFNEIYASYLSEPYPARSAVQVGALPKGALIEIEMIAQMK